MDLRRIYQERQGVDLQQGFGLAWHILERPLPSIGLCGTTRRRFPIIGRFQTGLGIFQPSNQDRTEARTEAEMRYYYFSFFLDFYYFVDIATTFMSK